MRNWLAQRLDDDARLWARLWSLRVTFFWAAFAGLWVAVPAFQVYIPPVPFALLCIAFSVVITLARILKQPGLE